MNNRPNRPKNIEPDTSAEGDSSINTKKGFLISLPSRKKKNPEESGIVPAKTVSGTAHAKSNERAEKNEKTDRPERAEKNERADKGDRPERTKNPSRGNQKAPRENGAEAGASAKNGSGHTRPKPNGNRNDKREPGVEKDKPERAERPEKAERNDKNTNNQNGQSRRDNRDKNQRSQSPKGQKDGGKEARDTKDVKDFKENRGKDTRKGQNDRNERKNDRPRTPKGEAKSGNDRGKGQGDRNKSRMRMPSLSPLSGDMMAFSKSDTGRASEKRAEKEPSLEEKYANAIPLAEQIAAEEQKRLARVRACNAASVMHKSASELAEGALESVEGQNVQSCEIVGIRFREAGKIYYFDPDGQNIPYGTPVVVETSRGCEYGYTAIANRIVPFGSVVAPLKKIKRLANKEDTDKYRANKELESEAASIFKKKVRELGLAMNLVFVEYTFDNSKLLFYFTAETRIDFRELVKELASIFRTRIELRQIGVRDEAKMLGGLGVCGRSVCCNSFLGDFAQVSIKMAKEQGLSLNSTKISGACGKLMCCLRFEDKVYSEEAARTPRVGAVVETAEGRGTVVEINPLKGEVKVSLENAPEAPAKVFAREDVTPIGAHENAAENENVPTENAALPEAGD